MEEVALTWRDSEVAHTVDILYDRSPTMYSKEIEVGKPPLYTVYSIFLAIPHFSQNGLAFRFHSY